jgi:formylglycine-generating enzyme required for sulfatase activity
VDNKNQKTLIIGSIAFIVICAILMVVTLVWEAMKLDRQRPLLVQAEENVPLPEPEPPVDYSRFQTIVGDDERTMVLIPEGFFHMGSDNGDPDEAPQHPVFVSSFYIDQYEVTNASYAQFLKASRNSKPFVPVFDDDPAKLLNPEQIAVGMAWDRAAAYCLWAGKRLSTEAEWEKAARGETARTWPWGDEFGVRNANIKGEQDGHQYTTLPGQFESGRSPYGIYDMAGNGAEWVADWYDEKAYAAAPIQNPTGPETGKHRVVRGGSWAETAVNVRTAKRFAARQGRADSIIGFRCAKDD